MKVLIDACVLYPTILREIVLGAAGTGAFVPVWSARILEEWARAAAKHGPIEEERARGEIAVARSNWPDAEVEPEDGAEDGLWLPDPADVHVLAAAIAAEADAILTQNLRDFPKSELAPVGQRAIHPDAFLAELYAGGAFEIGGVVLQVIATAQRLSPDPVRAASLLKRARLPRLRKALIRSGELSGDA